MPPFRIANETAIRSLDRHTIARDAGNCVIWFIMCLTVRVDDGVFASRVDDNLVVDDDHTACGPGGTLGFLAFV